jgi:hypothetical protein
MNKFKSCTTKNGFGLVDSILSLTLLAGVITYGVYFSSIRFSTIYSSNVIRSINKEIERDVERLKLGFWSMYYNKNEGKYFLTSNECEDFKEKIINLSEWQITPNSSNLMIQSWRPGPDRSKVFSDKNFLISRELNVSSPIKNENLNNSIAVINYRVEWAQNNIHWLSITFNPEAHSWCEQQI